MTEPSTKSASTRVSRIIKVPREAVYQAFLDRDAVASWLPPETMTGRVHTFGPREGGVGRCVGRCDRRGQFQAVVVAHHGEPREGAACGADIPKVPRDGSTTETAPAREML